MHGLSAGRHRLLTISAAIAVGVLVALQSRINAELSEYVGGGVIAAAISFGTGLVLAWVIVSSRAPLRASVAALPGLLRTHRLKWWQVLGGLGGAWLVTTQGLVVPATGVTIFTIAVVAGQVTGSLLVDRAGLSPAGHLPISGNRVVAAVVALTAVVVSGLQAGVSEVSWIVVLAVSAGLGIAVQQAINGRVAVATGQPMAATGVNFLVGFSSLFLLSLVVVATGVTAIGTFPAQWWLYVGGPIGVLFIALAAWAVRGVGVLVFGLLSIAGQLLGSVVIDVVAPSGNTGFGWSEGVALALVAMAVLLATASPSARRRRR
ncbi:MAG: DMT family transporter [Actinobacteria bacterium]|nr:DMT family transporter [Actinomycetota bacterium]MCB8996697.1 DMT family transporter [Actinomycetota bacterium]